MQIDFATIVTSQNLRSLAMQARSFERFVDFDTVGTINIIVNSFFPENSYKEIIKEVIPNYGDLKKRVEIYPIYRFVRPHINCATDVSSDATSLLLARVLESPFYLLMRPGDYFVRKVAAGEFGELSGNRSRAARVNVRTHTLRKAAPAFEMLGVALPAELSEFIADQIPFSFSTSEVCNLISQLEAQYNMPLDDIFAKADGEIDPIYLYVASRMREFSDIRNAFKIGPRMVSGLKLKEDGYNIDEWLSDVRKRIMANADAAADAPSNEHVEDKLAAFWLECGLFSERTAALAAIPRADDRIGDARSSAATLW